MYAVRPSYGQRMASRKHIQCSDNQRARRAGKPDFALLEQIVSFLGRQAARQFMAAKSSKPRQTPPHSALNINLATGENDG